MQELIYAGSGERIDHYLIKQFPYSRNFFHHIIARGGITVNQQTVKKSYLLKTGDQIYIEQLERFLDGGVLKESPLIDLDIRYETDDYLILYKPTGVLSHPNSIWDVQAPNIVGGLYHHYRDLPSYSNFIRAGLIHRLDKDTDGLMIIAKTEQGLQHFKSLFQQKSTAYSIADKEAVPLQKFYRATCQLSLLGETFLESIVPPHYIDEPVKPKIPHSGPPKRGITKIITIDRQLADTEGTVLIDLEILTGRTHQIRYHLSNHGLPIVGDYIYGLESNLPMQLTAWKIKFLDTTGKSIVITL